MTAIREKMFVGFILCFILNNMQISHKYLVCPKCMCFFVFVRAMRGGYGVSCRDEEESNSRHGPRIALIEIDEP